MQETNNKIVTVK